MVVVDETKVAQGLQLGKHVEKRQATLAAKISHFLLSDWIGRIRTNLKSKRKQQDDQLSPILLHFTGKLIDFLEAELPAGFHSLRVRLFKQFFNLVNLASVRSHQYSNEVRISIQQRKETRWLSVIVADLDNVIQADAEDDEIGFVFARDSLVGNSFLTRRPTKQRHTEDLDVLAASTELRFEEDRVGTLWGHAVAKSDTVAETNNPCCTVDVLDLMISVADAVGIDSWNSRGRVDGVEIAVPEKVPFREASSLAKLSDSWRQGSPPNDTAADLSHGHERN